MKLKDVIKESEKYRDRQYVSGKVLKYAMRYIPSNKQLFIQAVIASASEKGKSYQVRLVFNGLTSSPKRTRLHTVKYKDLDGSIYFLEKPTKEHHIMTRCGCVDFRHSFHWYIGDKKFLLGPRIPYQRKTTHYPEKNPQHLTGICKHLLTLIRKLISVRFMKRDPYLLAYLDKPKKEGKHLLQPKTKSTTRRKN